MSKYHKYPKNFHKMSRVSLKCATSGMENGQKKRRVMGTIRGDNWI